MSFEGYYQVLCENGHYEEVDCYDFDTSMWQCPECGGHSIYQHLIDQTNGDGDEQRVEFEIEAKEILEVCPTCGMERVVEPIRFKLPEEKGEA